MPSDDWVVDRMQALIQDWDERADQRAMFLKCYLMMTSNMLGALREEQFIDIAWVDRLLDHFAGYYFKAQEAYEQSSLLAPAVWKLAHDATIDPDMTALQMLLLGVNAHINYDLVLAVADMLRVEWSYLSEEQRGGRYSDYCHVNDVIRQTIDAVQDQILDPQMPVMKLIDRLFGPVDEIFISRLITDWREVVWQDAIRLLSADIDDERNAILTQVEERALKISHLIRL